MIKRHLGPVLGFLLAVLIALPAHGQGAKPYELRWGTAPAGGAWQILGSAMLQDIVKANPGITGSTFPSGVAATVMGINLGKYNIGFSLSNVTADAWEGKGFFKKAGPIKNLRSLATLFPHGTQIVVRAKSGIGSIADLRGKRLTPGARGLSNDLEGQRLLELYGMTYKDVKLQYLSFEDAASQFIDGHLDCLLFPTSAFPLAPVINVASEVPVKLLPIPPDKVAELVKARGVEAYTFPPNLYKGVGYPVNGIAVRCHLLARADMPDDVAYQIVKTIADNFSRYPVAVRSMAYANLQDMAKSVGIPLHPGAEKYYRERGWLK